MKYTTSGAYSSVMRLRSAVRKIRSKPRYSRSLEVGGVGARGAGVVGPMRAYATPKHGGTGDGMGDYPTTRPSIPVYYLTAFLKQAAVGDFQFHSYDSLLGPYRKAVGDPQREWSDFQSKGTNQRRRNVLLHYDVDANPEACHRVARVHLELGLPGSIMIFRKKIFDWKLKKAGIVEEDPNYRLDWSLLREFVSMGGSVGYHCNALDQANGNVELAIDIFRSDVEAISQEVSLKSFSMHGGKSFSNGMSNSQLPVNELASELGLTWVHNGKSLVFNRTWSDGSASNPRYRNEPAEFDDFLWGTAPGERTRLLFHPQYYNGSGAESLVFPILHDHRAKQEAQRHDWTQEPAARAYWDWRERDGESNAALVRAMRQTGNAKTQLLIAGMSRSGTTLMCTLLGSFAGVHMGIESYHHYLLTDEGGFLPEEDFIFAFQTLMNYEEAEALTMLDRAPLAKIRTLAITQKWQGLATKETGTLWRGWHRSFGVPRSVEDRFQLILAGLAFSAKRHTTHLGSKTNSDLEDLLQNPKRRVVWLVRDPLDVYVSQLRNGSFNPQPEDFGRKWSSHARRLEGLSRKYPDQVIRIHYEQLCSDPDQVMSQLCARLDIELSNAWESAHEVDHPLFVSPHGQLSAERVQEPVDSASIGLGQSLAESERQRVLDEVGAETLRQFGY